MSTIDRHIQAMRRTAKFMVDGAGFCELCGTDLVFKGMKEAGEVNVQHIWSPGMLFTCNCGKSGVWTNSIRNMDEFVAVVKGTKTTYPKDAYTAGLCNDRFCPFDGGYVRVTVNGFESRWHPGKYYDLYGCDIGEKGDKHNQSIVYNFDAELDVPEEDQLIPIIAEALGLT